MGKIKLLIFMCFFISLSGRAVPKPSLSFIVGNGTLTYDLISNIAAGATYVVEADSILKKTGTTLSILDKNGIFSNIINLSAGLNFIFISQLNDGRYLVEALHKDNLKDTLYYGGKLALYFWNPSCYAIASSLEAGVETYKLSEEVIKSGRKWRESFKNLAKEGSCQLL